MAAQAPFLSYIRLRGLTCEHAANGAPVPQRGAISAYRGHHWVIEDCTVNWANAVGIDVGNECWHHAHVPGEPGVGTDMLGRPRGEASLPGPFADWPEAISLKEALPCLE